MESFPSLGGCVRLPLINVHCGQLSKKRSHCKWYQTYETIPPKHNIWSVKTHPSKSLDANDNPGTLAHNWKLCELCRAGIFRYPHNIGFPQCSRAALPHCFAHWSLKGKNAPSVNHVHTIRTLGRLTNQHDNLFNFITWDTILLPLGKWIKHLKSMLHHCLDIVSTPHHFEWE